MSLAPEIAPHVVVPARTRRARARARGAAVSAPAVRCRPVRARGLDAVRTGRVPGTGTSPVVRPDRGPAVLPLAVGFGSVPAPSAYLVPGLSPRPDLRSVPTELDRRRPAEEASALEAEVVRLRPAAAGVRLTARGRLVVALGVLALAVGIAGWAWFGAASASTPSPAHAAPVQVVVHDGDTLWSIASQVAPGVDPRLEVDALRHLNHLGTSALSPGQVLRTR